MTLKVDKYGFYLHWVDQNNEMDMLDIAIIRDTRTGKYAKIPKVQMSYFFSDNNKYLACHYMDVLARKKERERKRYTILDRTPSCGNVVNINTL